MARSTSSRSCGPPGRAAAPGSASIRSRMTGSAMNPALITSARPLAYSARGQRGQDGQVGQHPGGRVERPDQVLALGDVDGRLAADRGVDHAEQRGRHQHDADAAQPGGGDEPGQVGDGPAADADDHVGAADPVRGQPRPQPGGHRDVLGRLAVGDRLGGTWYPAPAAPGSTGAATPPRPSGWMTTTVRASPADQGGQLAEHPGAHDHLVGLLAGRRSWSAHGLPRAGLPGPLRAVARADLRPAVAAGPRRSGPRCRRSHGSRPSVATVIGASRS